MITLRAVLLCAGAAVSATPVLAQAPAYTRHTEPMITMRDGVRLHTSVYVPATAAGRCRFSSCARPTASPGRPAASADR